MLGRYQETVVLGIENDEGGILDALTADGSAAKPESKSTFVDSSMVC